MDQISTGIKDLDIESAEEYEALRAAADSGPYRVNSQRERLMHLHGWIGGRRWATRAWRYQYHGRVYTDDELGQIIDILGSIVLAGMEDSPSQLEALRQLLPPEYQKTEVEIPDGEK